MPSAVLALAAAAVVAPLFVRVLGRRAGWVLALVPFGVFAFLSSLLPRVARGEAVAWTLAWAPSLGVDLAFRVDGLALLFALLVTGIGTLIVVFASGYMGDDPGTGRLHALLLAFMAAMLGVVTTDNLLALFVFWELTSVTSYLLIGYKHASETARKAALQALLVTGAGGLALLAGLLLLAIAGGSASIHELTTRRDAIHGGLYPAIVVCVLLGAFTKSAQVPFHFWLPAAMEAPTPISAYLHSATMVKAGVFLLARLSPVLSGTLLWHDSLFVVGAATMVVGAWMATHQTDLKRLLAYTTVATLGMLTMLLGLGTPEAVKAALVVVLAHALYKGALFMVAGIVDHEAGTRDILHLRGLWQHMPLTTLGAALAALSAAGLPPLVGFISKEAVYVALLRAPWLEAVSVLSNAFGFLVAAIIGWQVFFGQLAPLPKHPHEAPPSMWLGPVTLGAVGLALGALPWLAQPIVAAAGADVYGAPIKVDLALWHGVEGDAGRALLLSAVTIAIGLAFYAARVRFITLGERLDWLYARGPGHWYQRTLDGLMAFAAWQTRVLQNGYLRWYIATTVAVTVLAAGGALLLRVPLTAPIDTDVRSYEAVVVLIMLLGTGLVVSTDSRLTAIAGLGLVGYAIALVFLLYGAPDLALTQFAVETLSVVLFVLVLYRLPRFGRVSDRVARYRDAAVASAAGLLMTALVLEITPLPSPSRVSEFFAENSLPRAFGRNVVNVILVDFRALDTLGEATVIVIAALGVYALLRQRRDGEA